MYVCWSLLSSSRRRGIPEKLTLQMDTQRKRYRYSSMSSIPNDLHRSTIAGDDVKYTTFTSIVFMSWT